MRAFALDEGFPGVPGSTGQSLEAPLSSASAGGAPRGSGAGVMRCLSSDRYLSTIWTTSRRS